MFIPAVLGATVLLPAMLIYQVSTGIGVWGNNQPVAWGWDIINFVWWVGVAHAGTLISAMLFLTRQHWRTTIGRATEAMTVFSVMMAGLYPAIHVGRVWFAWFMFPIPNSNGLWPQFRSPLMWDVFAVNTYLMVSMLFWYMGMIPDLAVLRDRATTRVRKFIYGLLAMGWTGSARHWHHYEKAYVVLSGLCTLLVFTVSSIVGLDFCTSQLAGWHATIFPLYFVVGAVYCGFGMVLVLLIPLRKLCHLEEIITPRHMDRICKLTLLSSLAIAYIYLMEFFIAWYSGDPYERWVFGHRLFGHTYWYGGWIMLVVNVGRHPIALVQTRPAKSEARLRHRRAHQHRHVVRTLRHHRRLALPGFSAGELGRVLSRRGWTSALYLGTLGAFFMMYLLFMKFLPMIAIAEVKGAMPQADPHHPLGGAKRRPFMSEKPYGLMAEFDSPAAILHAAEKVRDAGYRRWDVFTPFPVHGLDKVMGFKNSLVGWFALVFGGGAFVATMGLIWFANAFDYPLIVGGKPMFSRADDLCAVVHHAGVGRRRRRVCRHAGVEPAAAPASSAVAEARFALVSRDKFFLVIGANDEKFSETETRRCSKPSAARTSKVEEALMRQMLSIILIGADGCGRGRSASPGGRDGCRASRPSKFSRTWTGS